MRRQTKSLICGFVVGESRRSSICVDNGLTGSRYLHQLECAYVCVVCCCCQEQSLSLAATNLVRLTLIFVLPCHESATVASSRKQGNSVRACSLHCCVASIEKVVRIIGCHLCVRSRVICVFVAQMCFRGVSSFVVASRLRRLIVLTIFSILYSHITDLCRQVDFARRSGFRSTFSTNLAMLPRHASVEQTNTRRDNFVFDLDVRHRLQTSTFI